MKQKSRWRRILKVLLFLLFIDGTILGLAEWAVYQFSPTYYRKVARAQQLSSEKADHVKRIFVFGESTIDGFPYPAENTTAHWLQMILSEVMPKQIQAQVVNFGKPARCAIHLNDALQYSLRYKPDLVVICVGHNEFLARSLALSQNPTHRWWYLHSNLYRGLSDVVTNFRSRHMEKAGVRPNGGIPVDGAMYQNVVSQFGEQVDDMVVQCQQAGVPVLLCIPGSNLACRPAFSQGKPLSAEQITQRDAWLNQAQEWILHGDSGKTLLDKAMQIDPHWAMTHYWQARQAQLDNQTDLANTAFAQARDFDALPFRCQTPLQQKLHSISKMRGVPLIDFPAIFQAQCNKPPGSEWFVDSCHPRPWGQHLMAQTMAKAIAEHHLLGQGMSWHWQQLPTYEQCMNQMKSPADGWVGPERRALLQLLKTSPEVAWELAQKLPAFSKKQDAEWQILASIALWRCGKAREAMKHMPENAPLQQPPDDWPMEVKQAWQELSHAADKLSMVRSP